MKRELGCMLVGLAVAACTGDIGSTFVGGQSGGNTATGFTTTSGQGGIGAMGTGTECSDCTEESNGVGTGNPFDTDKNPSDNVGTDDEGALVLDPSNSSIPGIIWIANTNQNTVTKVDTTTYQVLGRYNLGSNDPSRTSVNSSGDVFVGLRTGNALTKVSAAGKDCPDTNKDNVITTSTGQNDVLAYGQDDCVLWSVPVPDGPLVRAVAAQDEIVPDPIPDDPDNVKLNRYVWVGGTNHKTAYKFDGETGQLLIQTASPSANYGFALDAEGMLWVSGATEGAVGGRIDTKKCFDQQSCDAAEICIRDCSNGTCACTQCSVDCDKAIKERILLPTNVYGVTVDFKQRVWWGGNAIQRYNRFVPEAQRHTMVSPGAFVHGIGADAKGMVWGAASSQIVRLEGDSMQFTNIGMAAKGIAVDKDGKIWGVEYGSHANVVIPGPTNTLNDFTTNQNAVSNLGQCYTYSDMTGLQLALATNKPGTYRQTYDGCDEDTTGWYDLDWEVEIPAGTSVMFKGRSANTPEDLEKGNWVVLAKIPDATPKVSIADIFKAKNAPMGKLFELEVTLKGIIKADTIVSPKVKSFGVTYQCTPIAN